GWESSHTSVLPVAAKTALRSARLHLGVQLRAYPSAWIENKRSSFSIHLLDVPAAIQPQVRRTIRGQLKKFRALRGVENLRDVEVLPRSIPGKGRAVRHLLAQPAFRGAFPFYFGDDFSDESGFAAVRRGVSVHVGKSRSTLARYSLRSPAEVTTALVKLEAALSQALRTHRHFVRTTVWRQCGYGANAHRRPLSPASFVQALPEGQPELRCTTKRAIADFFISFCPPRQRAHASPHRS